MNRRQFTTAVAGLVASAGTAQASSQRRYAIRPLAGAHAPIMLLDAVVAPRLPDCLALVETDIGDLEGPDVRARILPALFELRTYRGRINLGIEPWLVGDSSFLIPFESLAQREQVWRDVTAQRTWPAYEFAIYRPRGGSGPQQQHTS